VFESLPNQVEKEHHQITNSDESPKKEEQIDSFVVKLENLILASANLIIMKNGNSWEQYFF